MKRKRIILIIAAACVLVLVVFGLLLAFGVISLTKTPDISDATEIPSSPTAAPSPTPVSTEVPVIENTISHRQTMVFAGNKLSFGIASGGLVSFIGSNEGQAYCYDWSDVIQIDGNSTVTVGLTEGGKLLVSSNDTELSDAVAEWSDIVEIAVSNNAIYGLSSNGMVFSTDDSTETLAYIRHIAAGNNFLAALNGSGELLTVGSAPDISALAGHELIEIAAGDAHIVALTSDGEMLSSENDTQFDGYTDIRKVFACGSDTAVIDSSGTLHSNCEFIDEPIDNVIDFSCGFGHALVLCDNGRVLAFGDNEYMQCEVSAWRLRPYSNDDGYIFGIKPGERLSDGSPVKTGSPYTLENGTEGIAIILGDINMDGLINEEDLELLNAYFDGNIELNEFQLEAANLLRDANKPDSIDAADAEQLVYHLKGFTIIDQYAKEFTYSGEVADAERFNKDTVGYVALENTRIVYPLMYGENFYYHYHNPAGVATSRSSIYLYYPIPTQNIVITGHNLRQSGLMLHDLHKLQNEYSSGYGVFRNRIWTINVYGETHYWEVFAMYEEKPASKAQSSQNYNTNYTYTMDTLTDDEIAEWISYQLERTELDYTINVTPNDQFMTFLTCSDYHSESEKGGRIYFFLRRVDGH